MWLARWHGFAVALASRPALSEPSAVLVDLPLDVSHPEPCQFAGDAQRVEVREGEVKLAELTFCSAYGRSNAKVVTDRAGVSYLLLRLGEGHGTNATSEYLSYLSRSLCS